METTQETLARLQKKAIEYNRILSTKGLILESCPFIVEVGAYTVGTDCENKTQLNSTAYPTQFSKEGVEVVLQAKFVNDNGPIKPVVYTKYDWYEKELKAINSTIKALELLFVENQKA